jgi:hypothetical protein
VAAGAMLVVLVRVGRKDEVVGMSQTIRIDDFGLSLESARRVGSQYQLRLAIHNNAQRVDFDFEPEQVIALDAKGNRVVFQCISRPPTLRAGQTGDAVLQFAMPPTYIKWHFGGTIGGLIDDLFYGDKRIRVEFSAS